MYLTLIKSSIHSLLKNKKRSLLTMLGIIVGTATLVLVLSLGDGLRSIVLKQLSGLAPDNIFVETKAPNSLSKRGSGFENVLIKTLTLDDIDAMKKLPNVVDGYGMVAAQGKIQANTYQKTTSIFGVNSSYGIIEGLTTPYGRYFTDSEDRSESLLTVLGYNVAKDIAANLGYNDDIAKLIGERIKIDNKTYNIVGINEERGNMGFMSLDDVVYIPINTALKKVLGQDHIQIATIKASSIDAIPTLIPYIENVLRRQHKIKDITKDDFTIHTFQEAMDIVGTVLMGVTLVLSIVGGISLLVGGVGIMNVMYVSVVERTREIGLRKAIGASPSIIKKQFLIEAITITGLGGIIGTLLGVALVVVIWTVAGRLGYGWTLVFGAKSVLLPFIISSIIGLIFGYRPAQRASELDPIEALRTEV